MKKYFTSIIPPEEIKREIIEIQNNLPHFEGWKIKYENF